VDNAKKIEHRSHQGKKDGEGSTVSVADLGGVVCGMKARA